MIKRFVFGFGLVVCVAGCAAGEDVDDDAPPAATQTPTNATDLPSTANNPLHAPLRTQGVNPLYKGN